MPLTAIALVLLLAPACGQQDQPEVTENPRALRAEIAYSEWAVPALVGLHSVQIGSSSMIRGDVAVVQAVAGATRNELNVLASATIEGDVSADSIALATDASVQGDAAYNGLTGTGSVSGDQSSPLAMPLPLTIPATPSVTIGSDNITLAAGTTRVLAAGGYNVVTLNTGARLQLSGGLYRFRRISSNNQGRVECLAACEVRVLENAVFQTNTSFGPASTSSAGLAETQLIVVGGNTPFDQNPSALQFGTTATLAGYVFVPNGAVRMGAPATIAGKVIARDVILGTATFDGFDIPVIVEAPESQRIRERQPATFDVSAEGRDLGYQWLRDGVPIAGATGSSYRIESIALSDDTAKFSVRITNRAGTVTSAEAELGVIPCESSDASCDGVDQDCSGQADEDYPPTTTQCGVGSCAASGTLSCSAGTESDSCTPGTPAESDTLCDGQDEDCDGSTDEEFVNLPTACGVGACLRSGTLVCAGGTVQNTCAPGAPAESDPTCDGVDDDCNGEADEDYVALETSCGTGECTRAGVTSCVQGSVVDSCQPGAPEENDVLCDGKDQDCSGEADEDYAPVDTHCGLGICSAVGRTSCVDGEVADSCAPGAPGPEDAVCDGVDSDCNGQSDEDYVAVATSCGVGACKRSSSTLCADGEVVDGCAPGAPAEDDTACNGVDDDCDGSTDEDYVAVATTCGVGACRSGGQRRCSAGAVVDSCQAGIPSGSDATCDAIDDDCDGSTDEDYAAVATSCGVGACRSTGQRTCSAGAVADSCQAGTPSGSDATCDGVDDDCDGSVDEDYAAVAVSCGVGACSATGMIACVEGVRVNDCVAGTPSASDASCDAIDNDCDGGVDEDYMSEPTACGAGACRATGSTSCAAGVVVDSCQAGNPAPGDATCDGVDDDCDGSADEEYVPVSTVCGAGACRSTGTTTCAAGTVVDSCAPGTPGASDSVCNGIDDDCDGSADEDYQVQPTSCGVGACGASGTITCENGAPVRRCEPGAPAANDATCDGIDEDCDGATDEEYAPFPIRCGVGACSSLGTTACVVGTVEEQCEPGAPAASDATCNAADDDCDGNVDEDYVSSLTTCGTGACRAAGATACLAGSVVDSCVAGVPGASDASCDGIDQDCDGSADEDYVAPPTACGEGACSAAGQLSCDDGELIDTCRAGEPTGSDDDCDGADDDCDGEADESFVLACDGTAVQHCVSGSINLVECPDGDPCNGEESCDIGACVAGAPLNVDDLNPCTIDSCEPFVGAVHRATVPGTSCGAGLLCNGLGGCIGTPAVTQQSQALAIDVRYPTGLRLGVRDGIVFYQFTSFGRGGAVQSQRLGGAYVPLQVPPVAIPWFQYSVQPLQIEIANFNITIAPPRSLSNVGTLQVQLVLGRRGPGSMEVIPVGVGN